MTEDRIREILEKALHTEVKSRDRNELKERLRANTDGINRAIKHGYTTTAIAKMLKEDGLDKSVETIRKYIYDIMGIEPTKRGTKNQGKKSSSKRRAMIKADEKIDE